MNTLADGRDPVAKVEFSGKTDEYFRIWIVNIALTIITLGIYSAWAKVRKLRYFYTHTTVADGTFDYHARPTAILFGRVIAVLMLGLYFGSNYVHPLAPMIIALLVFAIIPWLVVRSRIFQLRNTSFRGIRFNFLERYAESFKVFYLGALVTVFSFGLASPTALYWRNRFAIDNSGFGKTSFRFLGEQGRFYAFIYSAAGLGMLGALGYLLLMIVFSSLMPDVGPQSAETSPYLVMLVGYLSTVPIFLVYLAIGVYVQVRIRNYIWTNTTLGTNEFISNLSVRSMVFIYLTNVLAIACSLGLLIPWAQIRLARYRARHTQVVLADDWQNYVAGDNRGGSALGDEIGEAFDVDVDFGF